jgi:hypothetical protein
MKSRFEAHEISVRAGFRRAQEVRRAEGWPDFTDPERVEAEAATKRLVPGPRPAQLGVDPFDELTNGHRELAGVG